MWVRQVLSNLHIVLSFPPANKPVRETLLLSLPISKMRELKIRELKPLEVVSDEPGFELHLTVKALVPSATLDPHLGAPEKPSQKERCGIAQARTGESSITEAREETLSRRTQLLRKS